MTRYVLAYCPDYNGHAAYFMMRADDSRIDGAHYIHVASATVDKGYVTDQATGRRCRLLRADGRTWLVFSDWSARECAARS